MRYGCNSRPAGLRRLPSGVQRSPGPKTLPLSRAGGRSSFENGRRLLAPFSHRGLPARIVIQFRDTVNIPCRSGTEIGVEVVGSFDGCDRQTRRIRTLRLGGIQLSTSSSLGTDGGTEIPPFSREMRCHPASLPPRHWLPPRKKRSDILPLP